MNRVALDLFQLFEGDDGKLGKIVANGENLKEVIKEMLSSIHRDISKTELVKHLTEKLDISQVTAERLVYLDRKSSSTEKEWFYLSYLQELSNLSSKEKLEIQSKIDFLKINNSASFPIKARKHLTEDLCKIVGAHAADGTLRTGEGESTYIAIVDQYRENLEALARWFKNTFEVDLKVKPVPKESMWKVAFHNKVIGRYLNKIFGFKSGNKTYDVKEPGIIKNSSLKYRKFFALGYLTFESGIGIKSQVELSTRSEEMKEAIYQILDESGVKVTNKKEKDKRNLWRLWSNHLSEEQAKKWLSFFEKNTEKWFKLYEHANGFQGKVNNFEDAVKAFSEVFPPKSGSKTSLKEILEVLKEEKEACRYKIQDKIEEMESKWAHSLSHYLKILEQANIIKIEKGKFGKKKSFGSVVRNVHIYNSNISEWNVPYRPWLENKIDYE